MKDRSRIESPPRLERYANGDPEPAWRQSGRVRLFAFVAGITLVLGIGWTFLQPVEYRSSATVLMSAPRAIDAEVAAADIQSVAIQRKILLGDEITRQLAAAAEGETDPKLGPDELRAMLKVVPVPDTNLVEMVAEGSVRELLPELVNRWIDVYLDVRAGEIEQRKQQTMLVVQDELDGLSVKLDQARKALDQYRRDHEIISMERQENEVLARLDGINKALNNAIEEEAKTRAYLNTLRDAIRGGAQVVPQGDRPGVQELDRELRALEAEMIELNKRYTPEYIDKQPQLRAIPQRISELGAELARALSQGRAMELANATQAHAAARQTVSDLQRQLDQHKQRVAEFNTIYATHEALAEDLASLEELNRDARARLVQVEVRQVEKYPQVTVIDRPGADSERIGPDYLILLGTTLAAAIALGVFSVWLYGFLGPRNAQPAYVTLSGVHLYPQEVRGELAYSTQPPPGLENSATPLLKNPEGESDN